MPTNAWPFTTDQFMYAARATPYRAAVPRRSTVHVTGPVNGHAITAILITPSRRSS